MSLPVNSESIFSSWMESLLRRKLSNFSVCLPIIVAAFIPASVSVSW